MNNVNNIYNSGLEFVKPEITDKFKSLGFKNYYDVLQEDEQLKLLDLYSSHPVIT